MRLAPLLLLAKVSKQKPVVYWLHEYGSDLVISLGTLAPVFIFFTQVIWCRGTKLRNKTLHQITQMDYKGKLLGKFFIQVHGSSIQGFIISHPRQIRQIVFTQGASRARVTYNKSLYTTYGSYILLMTCTYMTYMHFIVKICILYVYKNKVNVKKIQQFRSKESNCT